MITVKKHKRKKRNGVSVVRDHKRSVPPVKRLPSRDTAYMMRNMINDYDLNGELK